MGNNITNYEKSLNFACINDDLKKFKKIIVKQKKNINYDTINYYFDMACKNRAEQIVIWFIEHYNIELQINTLNIIIKKNYFEIFLILLNFGIIQPNKKLFENSCKYNLDIVKWIYTINQKIKLNKNSFLNACLNEKIEIIDYFIENNFNYERNNDELFITICEICSKVVIDFMCQKCPRYKYIEYSDFFQPIIKDMVTYMIENKMWKDLIEYCNIKLIDNFIKDECIISLEDSNCITNCSHHYKLEHLMEWYLKKNTCPMCESKIELRECSVDKNLIY